MRPQPNFFDSGLSLPLSTTFSADTPNGLDATPSHATQVQARSAHHPASFRFLRSPVLLLRLPLLRQPLHLRSPAPRRGIRRIKPALRHLPSTRHHLRRLDQGLQRTLSLEPSHLSPPPALPFPANPPLLRCRPSSTYRPSLPRAQPISQPLRHPDRKSVV